MAAFIVIKTQDEDWDDPIVEVHTGPSEDTVWRETYVNSPMAPDEGGEIFSFDRDKAEEGLKSQGYAITVIPCSDLFLVYHAKSARDKAARTAWQDIIDKIRDAYPWDYEEAEGHRATGSPYRFDKGGMDNGASLWINDTGEGITANGWAPQTVINLLRQHNIKFIKT